MFEGCCSLTEDDNLDFGLVFAVHVLGDDLVDAGVLSETVLQRELGVVLHVHDRDVGLIDLKMSSIYLASAAQDYEWRRY